MTPSIELAFNARASTGESPTWCESEQALYWIDIEEPALHRFNPADNVDEVWEMPAEIGDLALSRSGAIIVALRTGLARFDPASLAFEQLSLAPYNPLALRFNDGKCDARGQFWIGAMSDALCAPDGHSANAVTPALYAFSHGEGLQNRQVCAVIANGLAWSPDWRTMFFPTASVKRYPPSISTSTPPAFQGSGFSRNSDLPTESRTGLRWTPRASTGAQFMAADASPASRRTERWTATYDCRSASRLCAPSAMRTIQLCLLRRLRMASPSRRRVASSVVGRGSGGSRPNSLWMDDGDEAPLAVISFAQVYNSGRGGFNGREIRSHPCRKRPIATAPVLCRAKLGARAHNRRSARDGASASSGVRCGILKAARRRRPLLAQFGGL